MHPTLNTLSIEAMESPKWLSGALDELYRDRSYATCLYNINQQRKSKGSFRVLVFQGSYMNG